MELLIPFIIAAVIALIVWVVFEFIASKYRDVAALVAFLIALLVQLT